MIEIGIVIGIVGVLLLFGVVIPLVLVGSWVYEDAKRFQRINEWLTPKIWVMIVIFSNYVGLIIYLIVRKTLTLKEAQCEICGYYNSNDANFCNRCGEPLDWPVVVKEPVKTSYKKLIIGGLSLFLTIIIVVGGSIFYAASIDSGYQSYSSVVSWSVDKKGGPNKGFLSRDFNKMIKTKEIFSFTSQKDFPSLQYELKAHDGQISAEVLDEKGDTVFKAISPAEGVVTKELKANTTYQVIVRIESAKDGRYAFDWQ